MGCSHNVQQTMMINKSSAVRLNLTFTPSMLARQPLISDRSYSSTAVGSPLFHVGCLRSATIPVEKFAILEIYRADFKSKDKSLELTRLVATGLRKTSYLSTLPPPVIRRSTSPSLEFQSRHTFCNLRSLPYVGTPRQHNCSFAPRFMSSSTCHHPLCNGCEPNSVSSLRSSPAQISSSSCHDSVLETSRYFLTDRAFFSSMERWRFHAQI